jgi:hypothetical protein
MWNQQREITFEFQFPADSISLDLMHGEYEDRSYVFRDQDDHQYTVEMPKAEVGRPATLMKHVSLPFTSVRRMTLTHNQSAEWGFGVDNIEFDTTPVALTFAITAQTPEAARRVLTHKYRNDDAYPSEDQTRDGRITIRATVKAGEEPRAGVKVWFRVVDPPDAAAYVVRAGDQRNDDNHDPAGGRLTHTEATSDGDGKVETELEITSFAAGDNYRVEASFNEDFTCPNAACPSTGILTAWKRVYVEVNKMFRRGTTVREPVMPGAKAIRIWDIRGLPDPPFLVRLAHAAPVRGLVSVFWSEVAEVQQVERDGEQLPGGALSGVLLLSDQPSVPGVKNQYDGGEIVGTLTNQPRAYLGDAAGVVTGVRSADYFLPNATLVNRTFADAYVEHVWLTDAIEEVDADLDASQPRIFFDGVIPFHGLLNENPDLWETEWLARKWMRNVGRNGTTRNAAANHQVVFTAANHPHDLAFNRTSDGFNDLWLFMTRLNDRRLSGEAFVHELAHEWHVNQGANTGGHCDALLGTTQQMHNRAAKCSMTSYMYGDPMDGERNDNIVGFHYTRVGERRDSEYLTIRRRVEPVPQVGLPRGEQ